MQAVKQDPKAAEPYAKAGKTAFANSDFEKAIENFTKAAELSGKPEAYSNRAAAYTSLARITKEDAAATALLLKAIDDADKALSLDKRFVKGYARKGAALFALKKYPEAKAAFNAGLDVDPTDKGLHDGVANVDRAIAASKKKKRDTKTDAGEGEVVIGIDLGTTYSCVSYWKDEKVIIIPNSQGQMVTPSYVSFAKGKRVVGLPAKMEAPRNPKNTVFDVKRIIGLTLEDNGVKEDVKRYPFEIVERERGTNKPGIRVEVDSGDYHVFAPEEISAFVLGYLKKCAEEYLKVPVTKAVITVPAYFNDAQRAATKTAGALAGLEVLRIINEPTAAALAYGLDKQSLNAHDPTLNETPAETVLIFDLGGGTFDVSVLVISNGTFEVKSTGGDTRLGGEDIDHSVGEHLFAEMTEKLGFPANIKEDERAFKRVMTAIEKAKRELSQVDETEINIEALVPRDGDVPAKDFVYKLTREEFERLTKPIYTRCIETVKRVIKDAGLGPDQINDIVLVGGSTRVPKIQSMLSEFFGGKTLCKSLNPDEAVAYGAAVQGAILSGKRTKKGDLLLLDVAPLSLGIETVGRVMSVVIPRNTPIPCTRTEIYTTESDFQTEVDVCVYEGERHKTTDNHLLGEFNISGIESAKKGEPKIDVQFSIDSNGILTVTAKDQRTGAEANIEIARGSRASPEEVARMTADAARYRKQDEENSRVLSLRNDLEQKIYSAQDIIEAATNSAKKGSVGHDVVVLQKKAAEAEALLHGESSLTQEQLSKLLAELTLASKKVSSKRA